MALSCYSDDWQRTEPDYLVHLPEKPGQDDEYADRKTFVLGKRITDQFLQGMTPP